MKKNLFFKKTLFLLIICHALIGTLKADDWSEVTNDIQMSIQPKNGYSVTNGQSCILIIRYKNVSTNETFSLYEENAIEQDPGYSWTVVSPSGHNIAPKENDSDLVSSGVIVRLPPGQHIKLEFDLNQLCRFNENGTYRISATRGVYWPKKKRAIIVASNSLSLRVVSK